MDLDVFLHLCASPHFYLKGCLTLAQKKPPLPSTSYSKSMSWPSTLKDINKFKKFTVFCFLLLSTLCWCLLTQKPSILEAGSRKQLSERMCLFTGNTTMSSGLVLFATYPQEKEKLCKNWAEKIAINGIKLNEKHSIKSNQEESISHWINTVQCTSQNPFKKYYIWK